MTLQTQHTANAPATLSDEQRRRISDALENAQAVNTRRNYAGQYRKFRSWCTASTILAGCVNRFCRFDSFSDC